MKTKKIKLLSIFLFMLPFCVVLFVVGCEEDDDEKCSTIAINGPEDDITGKWKLINGEEIFFNPRTVDYSCNNVVYHFQTDSILTITSDIVDIIGFAPGQYSYEFGLGEDKEHYRLKIDHSQGGCNISGSDLDINYAYLDGPILHFIRIQ